LRAEQHQAAAARPQDLGRDHQHLYRHGIDVAQPGRIDRQMHRPRIQLAANQRGQLHGGGNIRLAG
jgi:hypothetical protein